MTEFMAVALFNFVFAIPMLSNYGFECRNKRKKPSVAAAIAMAFWIPFLLACCVWALIGGVVILLCLFMRNA